MKQHNQLARESGRSIFGADAAGYHDARVGYPVALYDRVFCDLPTSPHILEVGAGTGIVTEQLLNRDPARLVVIEPDRALVDFMAKRIVDSRVKFVVAPFPDAPTEGTFDLIACAAAFHWMEPRHALARVRELLTPGGKWAVWWNSYRNANRGDPLADAISPLLEGIALPPSDRIDGHYSLDEAFHRKLLLDCGFASVEHHEYRMERTLSTMQVVKLFETYSYIRLLEPKRRRKFIDSLTDLVDRHFGGRAPNLVLTSLYVARN